MAGVGSTQTGSRARRHRMKHLAEQLGVGIDRSHRKRLEQFRTEPKHRLPILEHVGNARGRANIVLEHPVFVGAGAHQVDAANVGVDAMRWTRARAGDAILAVAEYDVGRDRAVGEDASRAVDVVDEGVDRSHPLLEPSREIVPFARGEDARDDVERDDPLGCFLVAIDGEGNAEASEGGLGRLLAAVHLGGRQVGQPFGERLETGARLPAAACPPEFIERVRCGHSPSLPVDGIAPGQQLCTIACCSTA